MFPHCNLALGRGNGDSLQKDLYQHAVAPRTIVVSVPNPVTGHCQLILHQRLLDTRRQVWLSLVRSLLLSPGSWYAQGFFYAHQESVSLEVLSPFARPPGWEICCGPYNFCNNVRTSLNNCSSVHGIVSYHFMVNRWENSGNSDRSYFLGLQNHYGWSLQPQN